MVLQPRGCGRVGRRRTNIWQGPPVIWWPLRHFWRGMSSVAPERGVEAWRREVRLWPRTVEDSDRHEMGPAADEVARPAVAAAARRPAAGRRATRAATPAAAPAATLAVTPAGREPVRGHPGQDRRPRPVRRQADGRQASGRRPAARAPGSRGGEGSPHGRPGGVRRTGPARAHHGHRARPWGPCPAEGPAREAGSPGRPAPGRGRSLHRRGPRARLPSRPRRPCPCLAHRGRPRGGG